MTSRPLAVGVRQRPDVENSPVNHATGQPALNHMRAAIEAGMHAITANKGTVVHGHQELTALAQSKGRQLLFESTVLGGAPVFSIIRECMPAADLQSFRGVLNTTTNIMLTRMERGETFEQAVRYCQSISVAETDPSADVDGWDASIKVAALVTVLMKVPMTPAQVERTGIRGITPAMIAPPGAAAGATNWSVLPRGKGTASAPAWRPTAPAPSAPRRSGTACRTSNAATV